MKQTTLKEDRQRDLEKHTLACPHCQRPVLDHMTKCPHCGGALVPKGYQPLSDKKIKKIRMFTYTIGAVVAIAIIVCIIVFRK